MENYMGNYMLKKKLNINNMATTTRFKQIEPE